MLTSSKIHFINRIDQTNVGDWNCCPLNYYFNFFRQYSLMRHDVEFVDWSEIGRHDVVIIGGGGMINVTHSFNSTINRLLERCDNVVAWGIGYNTHNEQWYQGSDFEEIAFERFGLIAIRDYGHASGLEWLPCPTAMAPEMRKKGEIRRKLGVIEHKNLPIIGLPYQKLSNAYNLQDVTDYISTTECIVTNSYHMVYWSHLMGRKAIVYNTFSTKFDYFKYKPEYVEERNANATVTLLEAAADRAEIYSEALNEAVALNDNFFVRVKGLVESIIPEIGNDYQKIYQLAKSQSWNDQDERRLSMDFRRDAHRDLDAIHKRIDALDERIAEERESAQRRIGELHGDLHRRVDQESASLHERITKHARDSADFRSGMRDVFQRMEELHSNFHRRTDQESAGIHDRITEREQELTKRIEYMMHLFDYNKRYVKEELDIVRRRIEELHDDFHRKADQEGIALHDRITQSERELMKVIDDVRSVIDQQALALGELREITTRKGQLREIIGTLMRFVGIIGNKLDVDGTPPM